MPAIPVGSKFGELTTVAEPILLRDGWRIVCQCSCGETHMAPLTSLQTRSNPACRKCVAQRRCVTRSTRLSVRPPTDPETRYDRWSRLSASKKNR